MINKSSAHKSDEVIVDLEKPSERKSSGEGMGMLQIPIDLKIDDPKENTHASESKRDSIQSKNKKKFLEDININVNETLKESVKEKEPVKESVKEKEAPKDKESVKEKEKEKKTVTKEDALTEQLKETLKDQLKDTMKYIRKSNIKIEEDIAATANGNGNGASVVKKKRGRPRKFNNDGEEIVRPHKEKEKDKEKSRDRDRDNSFEVPVKHKKHKVHSTIPAHTLFPKGKMIKVEGTVKLDLTLLLE